MRSHCCLSFALATIVCFPAGVHAQSSTVTAVVPPKGKKTKSAKVQAAPQPEAAPQPQAEPQQAAPPAAAPAETTATPASDAAATPAAAAAPETAPKLAAAESDEPAAHTVKTLPAGVEPNPPSDDDLKASGATWHGEYEAEADGKPLLGPDGRPLPVLYNKKGKRVKSKIKVAKSHPISIASGTMTVDGWTGKARLNYNIPDLKFIYLSAPSVGTVIVSQSAFPGSVEQKEAFNGNTLTVKAGEHELQLASEKPLIGKKSESAWVKFDPSFTEDPRYPVMGYGSAAGAPYEWPGAMRAKATGVAEAPPLPASMQPKLATVVCISSCPKPSITPAAAASAPSATATPASTVTTTVAPHPPR